MIKFLVRRFYYLLVTMLLASIAVFVVVELTPVDLANKVLGQFATPLQKERWRERNGLNLPPAERYLDWLIGNDWQITRTFDPNIIQGVVGIPEKAAGDTEWWALATNGDMLQWTMESGELVELRLARLGRFDHVVSDNQGNDYLCQEGNCSAVNENGLVQPAVSLVELTTHCDQEAGCQTCRPDSCAADDNFYRSLPVVCHEMTCWLAEAQNAPAGDNVWQPDGSGSLYFWGVDNDNHAVKWQLGLMVEDLGPASVGREQNSESGGVAYRPIQRGLLRGDPGVSFLTGRPVAKILPKRILNSLTLAGIAFALIMPLALVCGVIAGLNEGKALDRFISIGGLAATATPEFTVGALLLYFLVIRFKSGLPGAVTLMPGERLLDHPEMLLLPVLTLSMVELGYVIRMTRASVVEVMSASYIRTAFLKGLSMKRIIFRHVLRNALMTPITVIMLHVNWLVGGIVVVEALFGFPGIGSYLLNAALFGDVFAIEAGAMFMVILAVSTQMIADIAYTFLNPRIRYT